MKEKGKYKKNLQDNKISYHKYNKSEGQLKIDSLHYIDYINKSKDNQNEKDLDITKKQNDLTIITQQNKGQIFLTPKSNQRKSIKTLTFFNFQFQQKLNTLRNTNFLQKSNIQKEQVQERQLKYQISHKSFKRCHLKKIKKNINRSTENSNFFNNCKTRSSINQLSEKNSFYVIKKNSSPYMSLNSPVKTEYEQRHLFESNVSYNGNYVSLSTPLSIHKNCSVYKNQNLIFTQKYKSQHKYKKIENKGKINLTNSQNKDKINNNGLMIFKNSSEKIALLEQNKKRLKKRKIQKIQRDNFIKEKALNICQFLKVFAL